VKRSTAGVRVHALLEEVQVLHCAEVQHKTNNVKYTLVKFINTSVFLNTSEKFLAILKYSYIFIPVISYLQLQFIRTRYITHLTTDKI